MSFCGDTAAAPRFDYVACPQCVCGAPLPDETTVCKEFAWGTVRFSRCVICGSLVQAPRVTTASVAAWYDSAHYQAARSRDEGPYLDYLAEEGARQQEARGRVARDLAGLLPARGRVLEIGCATGSLLIERYRGTEYSEHLRSLLAADA